RPLGGRGLRPRAAAVTTGHRRRRHRRRRAQNPQPAMSARATTAPAAIPAAPSSGLALIVGLIGIAATALGLLVSGPQAIALSWLTAVTYWSAVAIGMMMMCFIHHIFDASWSTVIRRQWEHGLAAFGWLALLFLPLLLATLFYNRGIVWPWMDLKHIYLGKEVGQD